MKKSGSVRGKGPLPGVMTLVRAMTSAAVSLLAFCLWHLSFYFWPFGVGLEKNAAAD